MSISEKRAELTLSYILKIFVLLIIASIVVIIISMFFGGESSSIGIVFEIRLPRILMDFIAGAGLSVVGISFQSYFRNPLADPYILGISGAAAVGTLAAMLIQTDSLILKQLISFIFAATAAYSVYKFSGGLNKITLNTLILVGVGFNFFFSSIITFFHAVMNDKFSKNIIYWYMGDTSYNTIESVITAAVIVVVSSFFLYKISPLLNIYLLGDEITINSGVDIKKLSAAIYLLGSIITSAVVSVCGAVGFIGLIIPHIVRIILGLDHRLNMIGSFFVGGIFLVILDTATRTIFYPTEIPLGAVTAVIGTPLFILILRKKV